LADRVLLKTKTAEQKTTGGILLPSAAQSKPQSGEVVAIGEGRIFGDSKVEVGIKVWFLVENCDLQSACSVLMTSILIITNPVKKSQNVNCLDSGILRKLCQFCILFNRLYIFF
jgi:hypothetical protein